MIVYGGAEASTLLGIPEASPFHLEYKTPAWIIEFVADMASATDRVHQYERYVYIYIYIHTFISFPLNISIPSVQWLYCSTHFVCIVTEDREAAETFLNNVDW